MIGVPYINSLFTAIFADSKIIDGRFYLCPFWGTEINKGNLAEIVSYVEPYLNTNQKDPAALLMPMRESGQFQYLDSAHSYTYFDCSIVFVTNAYVTGQNQISTPAAGTNTATHTIPETWHDMNRVAKNFLQVLFAATQDMSTGVSPTMGISDSYIPEILQVTNRGDDSVTGVMLKFRIALAFGCTIEDYDSDYLTAINWPAPTDSHPLHKNV